MKAFHSFVFVPVRLTSRRAVVWRFFDNHHVMRVAFAQASVGDAHEACIFLHVGNGRRASVAHSLAQAADKLVYQRSKLALVGDARLDTFGDQVAFFDGIALEVAPFAVAALLHRADGTHTTIVLEPLAMRDNQFAGTLLNASKQTAQHNGIGTGGNGLRDIA